MLFVLNRRRETDVKSGVHCQDLEGEEGPKLGQVSSSVLEIIGYCDQGQCQSSKQVVVDEPLFTFPNISDFVLTCVKIHLFFYNMVLKLVGLRYWKWHTVNSQMALLENTKTLIPSEFTS